MAFYRAVLAQATGQVVPVHIIAVEKRPPFRCGVWQLDEGALAPPEAWLRPPADLAADFWDELGQQALRRTAEVAEACRFGGQDWGFGVLTFPRWEGGDARAVEREETGPPQGLRSQQQAG